MKRSTRTLAFLAFSAGLMLSLLVACNGNGSAPKEKTSVTIGAQTWMTKNMDAIPREGNSWCYNNDSLNCKKYGRLYDWEAAKSVCPQGWRLPTQGEFTALISAVANGDGKLAARKLLSKTGRNEADSITNEYGFSALLGGCYSSGCYYSKSDIVFSDIDTLGLYWSSTTGHTKKFRKYAVFLRIRPSDVAISSMQPESGFNGFSVRCIKNNHQ